MSRKRDRTEEGLVEESNCQLDLDFVETDQECFLYTSRGEDRSRHVLGSQKAATISDGAALEFVEQSPLPRESTSLSDHEEPSDDSAFWEDYVKRFPQSVPMAGALPRSGTLVAFHTKRYCHFLRSYLGCSEEEAFRFYRSSRASSMIGVVRVKLKGTPFIKATRTFLRHSVLSVEGDAFFVNLMERAGVLEGTPLQTSRTHRYEKEAVTPNARCVVLHYGLKSPTPTCNEAIPSFPYASLIVVLGSTRIESEAEIVVSLESYYRCLDEARWYRQYYGRLVDTVKDGDQSVQGDIYDGYRRFECWPKDLPYFHGIGDRHVSPTAEASFPFTLVHLGTTPELGATDLGVTARYPIPYATCFIYAGPSITTKRVQLLAKADNDLQPLEESEEHALVRDDTYALGLGSQAVCFGQGLSRYINHRYNLRRYGNVELCSVMLTVKDDLFKNDTNESNTLHTSTTTRRSARRKVTKTLEAQSHNVTIPFFITTSDIEVGEQLLAWSYGEDYDAKLERQVVTNGFMVPYQDAEVLNQRYWQYYDKEGRLLSPQPHPPLWQRYNGDYRFALKQGDIVWRRRPVYSRSLQRWECPPAEEDLFVVEAMMRNSVEYALLSPLLRCHMEGSTMRALLKKHNLTSYRSPHTKRSHKKKKLPHVSEIDSYGKRMLKKTWGIYQYCPHAEDKELYVATVSSLFPFQNEMDYVSVNQKKHTKLFIFNLDDVRHLCSLILDSHRACEMEPLLNGLVWPILYKLPK